MHAFALVTPIFVLHEACLAVHVTCWHQGTLRVGGTLADFTPGVVPRESIFAVHETHDWLAHRLRWLTALADLTTMSVFGKSVFAEHQTIDRTAAGLWGACADVTTVVVLEKAVLAEHETLDGAALWLRYYNCHEWSLFAMTGWTLVFISDETMLTCHQALDGTALATFTHLASIPISHEAKLAEHEALCTRLISTLCWLSTFTDVTAIVILHKAVLTEHKAVDG